MGFPLGHNIFGGAFLYGMQDDIWDLGLVVGLDYSNPAVDSHHELQLLKTHPWMKSVLNGGELISYGAKSLPEGGWFSIPKLTVNGAMLIGDSAGFMNGQRLKGIHLAMKSGMLAAETIVDALSENNFSDETLSDFEKKVNSSWLRDELWKVRNNPWSNAWWKLRTFHNSSLSQLEFTFFSKSERVSSEKLFSLNASTIVSAASIPDFIAR
jgi:electron-transferring-flavoprotein dehydrogenase